MSIALRMAAVLFAGVLTAAAPTAPLIDILAQELDRNFQALKQKADPPPYFLSYQVTEQDSVVIGGTWGALNNDNASRSRTFDVSVRVGSPKLDNYHRIRGDRAQFTGGVAVSLDDEPAPFRQRLWLETDRAWRAAAERLIKIRTSREVRAAESDDSDDFSTEPPSVSIQPAAVLKADAVRWRDRIRKLSGEFRKYPAVLNSGVTFIAQAETRTFVNTEGTRVRHGRGYARVFIQAQAKAPDGMDLASSQTFEAVEASGLPSDAEILAAIQRVAQDVTGMLKAPAVEPFVGPAIFSGRAAGVFFHEIFGHRIEGHRQKDDTEGQTFTRAVGTAVLPEFLSVTFDPARRKMSGVDLNGWYDYDDEGVPGKTVTLVDKGILKGFLMSRSPVKGFGQSNGHGRRQPGLEVVSRQSNLIVDSGKQVPEAQLRDLLIAEVKRQSKPYGLYFREVTGGFTTTSRAGLQAFKVLPLVVYRVYADGRPDELVRGADIVGTPLASFGKILATSDKHDVFNGYCGAESGSVPVSAVSPALLVSEIEIEKRQTSADRPPLLPPPPFEEDRRQ